MTTSAFTCTGPYAVLVMLGVKRVENRSMMPVPARGRCAVTCSKSFCAAEYGAFVHWASQALPTADFERIPSWGELKDWPGKVVGCCDYSARGRNDLVLEGDEEVRGRTRQSASLPWDEGYEYWWDLSGVVRFERPIPCRGSVGMWQLPPDLAARVTAEDALAAHVGEKIATAEQALGVFLNAIPIAGENEGFFALPLDDSRHALSAPVLVSLGDSSTAVVRAGEVFAAALKADAKAVIVAHNHPSGDPTPSGPDRELTAEIVSLGERLGVKVLDHLVVGGRNGVGLVSGVRIPVLGKTGIREVRPCASRGERAESRKSHF